MIVEMRKRFPYSKVLSAIESTLRQESTLSKREFDRVLNRSRRVGRRRVSDDQVFELLVMIPFYSGFRASTVTKRRDAILRHFRDYRRVVRYSEAKIRAIISDEAIIRNRAKVQAAVDNARALVVIIDEHGSFQRYLACFGPRDSFETLMLIKEDIQHRFSYLGEITAFHLMTDLGLNVLKPDRSITRLLFRLGLIAHPEHLIGAVIQGRRFAQATGEPIRLVDTLLVKYGQQGGEAGILRGICLERSPDCHRCGIVKWCSWGT